MLVFQCTCRFFDIMEDFLTQGCQKRTDSKDQSQFSRQNISLSALRTILSSEHQIRKKSFMSNIVKIMLSKNLLFSKNMTRF